MSLLLPNPHPKQAEFLADPHRYKVLNWGRRTGKSVAVWEKVVLEGMLRQGTYYIIAPTYKQAKSIYWRDICKTYKGEFMSFNEQELAITFDHLSGVEIPTQEGVITVNHDPSLPPTRIELKGADNPDSLRGTGICGAVLDEFAFMVDGKYMYDTIIRPALSDKNGWAVFISTPNGMHNHFYDLCQKAQEDEEMYFFSHATAQDNPYFPKQEWAETRREYEKDGKIDQFNQEWEAQFSNPTQLVYNEFSREKHVFKDMSLIPQEGTFHLSVDFGMTDPTAASFVKIDYEGNWWIFDEVYKTGLELEQLIAVLREKMGDDRYTRVLGDGAARFQIESMRKRKFHIIAGKKGADSIFNGINELKSLLKVRESTGKPKLFIHASCRNTIREFESYSWERDSQNEITSVPEGKNNHAMDELRYLALDKRKPVQRTKRERHYDPDTGRAWN
ncbi:Terminase RNAseH like domain containing protein [uncultured Caudovirales phage]|uniref:Terminase RNAseH like domain containing protein n=1 Tax=uncultured Caudovirales phage TaxID=2100421 RepID=A0A6J5QI38_9CAUD|nr:Terminase RNAseH like domain containing protein [uncultured Caudovirales phage]CAB4212458.1 Terminase RNAseH like domain containing protein [uncultured Caudovirales phage]